MRAVEPLKKKKKGEEEEEEEEVGTRALKKFRNDFLFSPCIIGLIKRG